MLVIIILLQHLINQHSLLTLLQEYNIKGYYRMMDLYNSADDDDTLNASRTILRTSEYPETSPVTIIDEYGRPVDFNNMDWSCTLSFDILYS